MKCFSDLKSYKRGFGDFTTLSDMDLYITMYCPYHCARGGIGSITVTLEGQCIMDLELFIRRLLQYGAPQDEAMDDL